MRYPSYPDYTATRWSEVGSIPTGWEARRLKFSVSLRNEKIEAENNELDYMGLEHIESWTGKRIEDDAASSEGIATRFVKDDVLFGKLRPYLAKVYLAEKEGMATTEVLVLMTEPALVPVFLKYLLLSEKFIDAVSGSTFGAKMPRANWEAIGGLPILLPSHDEQQQIAAFLDWKTGQIDVLIAKKKELLEKLKEKRLAVITQAVTKGLPSTGSGQAAAPLRDSGIPWLGQVPEHWEVKRLKDYGQLVGGSGFPIDDQGLTGGELPYYKVGDLKAAVDGRKMGEAPNTISRDIADRLRAAVIPPNAVVYAKIGAALLLNRRRITSVSCCIDNNMTAFIPDHEHLDTRWVYQWLSIIDFAEYMNPGAVPSFSEGYQSLLPICVPPLKEQEMIAEVLDSLLPQIDELFDTTERTIQRLTEYRTALITAATTGKIDVRQVAVPSPAQTSGQSMPLSGTIKK